MKNKNVGVLILIVVLLVISLSGVIYGSYIKYFTDYNKKVDNPNKEFKYNNSLYFYKGENLLGKYTCKNTNCGYPINTVDSLDVNIKDYQVVTVDNSKYLTNNEFVFIKDDESDTSQKSILYDLKRSNAIITYDGIKLYNNRISNNRYIVKLNEKYGVLSIQTIASVAVKIEYDYIGVKNALNENNELIASEYIVKKDNKFYLISTNATAEETSLTEKFDYQIIDYNDKYVVLNNNQLLEIYSYDGVRQVSNYNITKVNFLGSYVEVVTNNNLYFIYDLVNSRVISRLNNIAGITDYSSKLENNQIIVTINKEIVETIELT